MQVCFTVNMKIGIQAAGVYLIEGVHLIWGLLKTRLSVRARARDFPRL